MAWDKETTFFSSERVRRKRRSHVVVSGESPSGVFGIQFRSILSRGNKLVVEQGLPLRQDKRRLHIQSEVITPVRLTGRDRLVGLSGREVSAPAHVRRRPRLEHLAQSVFGTPGRFKRISGVEWAVVAEGPRRKPRPLDVESVFTKHALRPNQRFGPDIMFHGEPPVGRRADLEHTYPSFFSPRAPNVIPRQRPWMDALEVSDVWMDEL